MLSYGKLDVWKHFRGSFFFYRSGGLELEAIPQTEPVFGASYDYHTSNPKLPLLFLVET